MPRNREHVVKNVSVGDTIIFKLHSWGPEIQLKLIPANIAGNKILLSTDQIGFIGTIELEFPEGQLFQIGNMLFRWEKNREISILGAHGKDNDQEHC